MNPIYIGTVGALATTQETQEIATSAIGAMRKGKNYCVTVDRKRRVHIESPNTANPDEIAITCGRTACPDSIAENIQELASSAKAPANRGKVLSQRRTA